MFRSNLDNESRGSMLNLRKKKKNTRSIIVDTLDARLYFDIENGSKARVVFDLVCHTIGLRETSFFGLAVDQDTSEFPFWLKLDKKLFDQISHIFKEDQNVVLQFYAKFFPESAEDELLQDVTKHYFALQYQFLIQKNFIECTYDAGELLAAFSAQIKYGNFSVIENENLWEKYKDFVPQSTLNHYNNNEDAIVKAVSMWHIKHKGMCREAAEHEYVNIVHDFPMCGVNYYEVQDSNGVNALLGVKADSVSTYPTTDKINPTATVDWNSLVDMSYTERKFTFKYAVPMPENDSKKKESSLKRSLKLGSQLNLSTVNLNKHSNHYYEDLTINVKNTDMCKYLIDICRGNHTLYMERRKLGRNMELQQMKTLALEEKDRREKERESSLKDVDIKLKFHEEKMEMIAKYKVLEKKYNETLVSLEAAQAQASSKKELEKYKERVNKLQYDLEIKQQENDQLKEEVASLKKKLNRHSLGIIRSSSFKQNSPQSVSSQQHIKSYHRNQLQHQDGNGYHPNNSGDYQPQQFAPQYEFEQPYPMYNNQHSRSSSQASRHNAQKYHRQSPANRSYDDHHEIQKSNKEYESTSSKMEQSFQEIKSNMMSYEYSCTSSSNDSQDNLYFQPQSVDE